MIRFFLPCVFSFIASSSVAADVTFDKAKILLLNSQDEKQNITLNVRVADSPSEWQRGLMHVKDMPRNEGMLFVWPHASIRHFWMKNTLIPLDAIFFRGGQVKGIIHNMQPHDLTPKTVNAAADTALEVNAGLAEEYQIDNQWRMRFLPITSMHP